LLSCNDSVKCIIIEDAAQANQSASLFTQTATLTSEGSHYSYITWSFVTIHYKEERLL